MRLRSGTSGYAFKEWKGHFYPESLPAAQMLRFYGEHLETVEINNTFYRMPTEKLLLGWADQVPGGFSFVLKAPRRITHQKKLLDADEDLARLIEISRVLGSRLGPTLFQLPPYFKKDQDRLERFLALLPAGFLAAFEFRNASWFDEEVYGALRRSGVALVVADTDDTDPAGPPSVPTASHGYLRLRRQDYDDAALARWVDRVGAQPWEQAHVFFKHEDEGTGPRLARRFAELFSERS